MIVNTSVKYNSNILYSNISTLLHKYSYIKEEIIGYSVFKRPIYCLIIGNGKNQVFFSGAFHANEWIVSPLLMKFIEDFCFAYDTNSTLYDYNINNIYNNTTIYIVPMVNPDGVDLVTNLTFKDSEEYLIANKIARKYPDIIFPDGWKANLDGVDLNLQFPAGWENAKGIKSLQGYSGPSPRDFVGSSPLSEPESIAIYNYTKSHNFDLIIAYHSQGKEIYWQFQDYAPKIAYSIGLKFAALSGYSLTTVPYQSSFAGYKDWFLQEYKKPAYTIEVGYGENPLPISQFNKIYNDNVKILLNASSINF